MYEASKMLSEHEPIPKDEKPDNSYSESTPEEIALIKKCEALLQKSKKVKSKTDYCWIDYYKLFRGRQWKEERPTYRASEVVNLIWQTIQASVPIMMDVRPKFEYLPQEPGDREFAKLMNDVAMADWTAQNWMFTLTEVCYDSHNFGTGTSSLKFNPKKDRIEYRSEDPFYIFPDPEAQSFDYRCSYVQHAEPHDVQKMKLMFPDKANCIKPDIVNFACEKYVDLSTTRYSTPTSDIIYAEISGNYGYETNKLPEVLVKTCYLEDDEVLQEEIEGDDGAIKIQSRLKYPNGRRLVYCNEVMLDDGPNEYEDERKYPYQRLVNYILPRSFWGIAEAEPLEGMQRTFNKVWSATLDVLYLMGNPIWIVDSTADVDTQNLTNQPGLVVEKNPGSEVRRESGVALQPYVLSILDRLKDWFDQIGGSQDITRGIAPGAVTAASAIADLQNAAQTRIRLKSKNMDAYLQELGQSYAARVMQFYTAPRVFRLTGDDGADKYFKMHIQKLPEGGYKAFVNRYTENNLESPYTEEYELRGKLDVRVTTGSSLAFSKTQNEQQTYALFDRGIIDAEEVLKRLEYPNYEAILQRKAEMEQKQAQQQAAQSQKA